MVRRLSLRQIEAFKAVIEEGTAARAADVLNISQPAMSKLLARLEEDTGFRLFDRTGSRLMPTDRARRFYMEVDKIFSGLQQVERAVELIRREDRGHLVIGVMPALSGAVVQRLLMRFREQHPGVYLTVIVRSSFYISHRVRTRHIDVGLINADIDDPEIIAEPFAARPLVCILPIGHPLAEKPVLTLADLHTVPMITFERTSYTGVVIERALAALDFHPNVVIEATAALTIGELVAAGVGVALFHPIHVHGVRDRVEVRPLLPEIPFNLVLCRRRDVRSSALVESFLQSVRTVIQAEIEAVVAPQGDARS